MLNFNNYSKYYSQISLYFNLFLETNFYRYSFLTNFTTLKKNRVLGYNLFSRVKGFAPYALKNNILKINFDYLHSKTLNNKILSNKILNFDYFNFWSDSNKKYQDFALKDLFISLNKKKKLKPFNISLDYTIMDNDISKYNLNDYTDIVYIHKYDLLYSLNFNLFYNIKHHFYSKIWLLDYFISLNSIFLNKILGNFYWNLNYDFSYFYQFFNYIKIECLIQSFNYIKNYNFFKYFFLNNKKKSQSSLFIINKVKNFKKVNKKLFNWFFWNKKYHRFYPLKIYKRKRRHLRYYNKKYKLNFLFPKFNIKNSYNSIKSNNIRFNTYLVKKVFSTKFSKYLGNLAIKIFKLYIKFCSLKSILQKFMNKCKIEKNKFKSILHLFFNKIKKQKKIIKFLVNSFNKKIKKYNKFIMFFYSFIKILKKQKKNKKLFFLPYFRNRKYIKKISSYFFFVFKYIYIYFKKYLYQSWYLKSKLFKYFAISIIKTLPKNLSVENFVYSLKNNKIKIASIISSVYKSLIPLKKKLITWQDKKKLIIKKKLKNELNYTRYIKRRNFYHRIRSYKLGIKLTPKIKFLIEKRAAARKVLYNNSIGLLQKKSWKNLKFLKNLKNLKFKKPKIYAEFIKSKKLKKIKLELINLMKLKNIEDQDSIVLILLKKKKHPYYKHFEVLKYLAKYLNIPFILEELISPSLLHSIEVFNNIDKYDISNLPLYNGTNILKKGIINDRDKKLFKSTLCEKFLTRRIYFDIYKSKKSIYEYLGIDLIIDQLKFYNPDKIIKEYAGMYKQRNKAIPTYFNYTIKFNDEFYSNLEKLYGYPTLLPRKVISPFINISKALKNRGNNNYLNSLLKDTRYNNFFLRLLKEKGINPYFFKVLKKKLINVNFIKMLEKSNPVIVNNFTKNLIRKSRPFFVKSNLDIKYWKLFGKIYYHLNNLNILYRNIIFKNRNIINNTYLNLNKYYSFIFIFFLRIFYRFSKFLIKRKKIRKFKGFSYSIKRAYKRFIYRLKYKFVKNYKLIKNKKKKLIKKCSENAYKNLWKKKYNIFIKVKKNNNKKKIINEKIYKLNVKLSLIKKLKKYKKLKKKKCILF